LTYALRSAGYDAVGLDISTEAISKARARFGPFYVAASLEEYCARSADAFDAVILVEVIEHLEDPVSTIKSALRLLAPGGCLIATTPNRSYFGRRAPWTTDLPPVHLWWFSEESLTAMARSLGCDVSFVDFTEYNAEFPVLFKCGPPLEPMFDSEGKIVRCEAFPIAMARKMGILQESYRIVSRFVGRFWRQRSARRPTMVAQFTPIGPGSSD
jgi:SAM-dependent methyltransferase